MTEHTIDVEVVFEVRRKVAITVPHAVSLAVAKIAACARAKETFPGNCTARLLAGESLRVKKVRCVT
jgi:hypothetical protein